jgi:hypothetical protein
MTAAVSEVLQVKYSCGESILERPEFHRHARDLADDSRRFDPFESCLKTHSGEVDVGDLNVGSTTMLMPLKRVTPEHSETNVKYVGAAAAVSALCLADAIRIYGCDTPLPEATATFLIALSA